MPSLDRDTVLNALRAVIDPDLHRDIVSLGFVKDLTIADGRVSFAIELTTPACPVKDQMRDQAVAGVRALGVEHVDVRMTAKVRSASAPETGRPPLPGVKNVIAVGAGKGGVGKTTVAVNLALSLARCGSKVGILDGDIYGPNVPIMLGITTQLTTNEQRQIVPAEKYGLQVISIGFLTNDDAPIIWRGPMLHGAIQQFFKEVAWTDLDYLIIDMPPGTGDVALSLSQTVPVVGAIVVTTPQLVALADSRRAVRMYQKLSIPTLGVVENMSYYSCPNCHHESDIFGHGGGEGLATDMGVPFLGRLPIYQPIREGSDIGVPLVVAEPASIAARAFLTVAERAAAQVSIAAQKAIDANKGKIPLIQNTLVTRIELPYSKRTLANGLDVIVHEDRHVPVVAVNLWYHVGSKDEVLGRTGFAHLFEHLMFEGSEHHNSGFFPPLQQAGALLNGSTNTDRTNYWEVVPTSAVDLALWMESDRMGYFLPALTRERFETQRDVVLNERRQNYENRPYGFALMALLAALYPPDHPYHWMTIGAADDIRAMQFEDVREFFRTYYHPANASLVLAGDIDTERAFDLAGHYFGDLPAGVKPAPVHAIALLRGERRLLLEDRVELPRLYMVWHSPAMFGDGDAELDLVGDLLGNGKTSRLYQALVYEQRIAVDVSCYQSSRELGGFFLLVATAAPGRSLTDLGVEIDRTIQALVDNGPTDAEMERGEAQAEAHFLYRLQTVGGFGGKSDQLNAYNVMRGNPGYFAEDLARYQAATADRVRAAARHYLRFDARVVLSMVPRGQQSLALPGSEPIMVS